MVVEEYEGLNLGEGQRPRGAPSSTDEEERVFVATQWQLMWWRFRRHKVAMGSAAVLGVLYMFAIGAEFLSSAHPVVSYVHVAYLPPQTIHWFDDGRFSPYVEGITGSRDPKTFKLVYETHPDVKIPVSFFVRGWEYKFLGLIKMDRHLIGIEGGEEGEYARAAPFLLGTDILGRDMYSRIIAGTRISLSIGLVGVTISLLLGIVLGGLSGYYGGWADNVIQRIIEITRSIPTIPLWVALAVSVPRDWSIVQIYLAITLILSAVGWTELGRVVRGRFLSMREEDFIMAARIAGASDLRVIFRHMVPSFTSHIIAAATLAIPFMIIAETALSFLGLGLRPPAISWGVLLQATQNVQSVAIYPWLMIPAFLVVIAVLAFNFFGDGLRDAADPYST